jgi:hypothetical protein
MSSRIRSAFTTIIETIGIIIGVTVTYFIIYQHLMIR